MTINMKVVNCEKCGLHKGKFESGVPCNSCGSVNPVIHITINDTGAGREKLGIKCRSDGVGRPLVELVSGDDLHRNTGTWREIRRVINREKNEYHEVIKDATTGEILHECHEPLSEHRGHGAAGQRSEKLKKCTP